MNIKDYNKKIEEKYGKNKFIVFESNDEIHNRDKIKIKCLQCNDIRENVDARSFIRIVAKTDLYPERLMCKKCLEIKKANEPKEEPIKKRYDKELAQEIAGNRFEVLEYINSSNVKVKCLKCNSIITKTLDQLRKDKGCINCNGRREYTEEDCKQIIKEKFENKYEFVKLYKKTYENTTPKAHIVVKYKNQEYDKALSDFLKYGFEREIRRNINYLKEMTLKLSDGKVELIDNEYISTHAKYRFKEIKSGKIVKMQYDNFVNNPMIFLKTKHSSYEILVFKELNSKHIYFNTEKRFTKTGDVKNKRFDIFLSDERLIEIDGGQHFDINIPFYNTEHVIENDQIKNKFCKDSNKILLRISYKEFQSTENYKKILKLFLNKKYNELLKYNIFLVKDGNYYNFNSYYEPIMDEINKLNS